MYHKLGPCPEGARLKFLYVSQRLFCKQIHDIIGAGFTTVMPDGTKVSGGNSDRSLCLSFDDGFENVLRYGLEPMRANHCKAIQFLVPSLLGKTNEWETASGEAPQKLMDPTGVREWLAEGHEIGAHTMTHPNLKKIPLDRAREEIAASKKSLEDLFGRSVRHFCYPFGAYNEKVRDLVAEAGFETACTTRAGLNDATTPALELKRLTARPVSIKFRDLWREWFGVIK
jgi:peptidoglycan/xylan/chitin deacetylase (PgdA/CDA1 family)